MDFLSNFFLFFGKEVAIGLTFLLGYFFYSKKLFFHVLLLTLTGIIVAAFLKSLFKVPLMPHLGTGWALPSGHMLVATVFWGFLATEIKNKAFSLFTVIILLGVSISLVYRNYHHFIDIIAAVIFALIIILCYRSLLSIPFFTRKNEILPLGMVAISYILIFYGNLSFLPLKLPLGGVLGLFIGKFLE